MMVLSRPSTLVQETRWASEAARSSAIIRDLFLDAIYRTTTVLLVGPSSDAVLREQSKRGQSCLGVFLLLFSIILIAITFPVAICLSLKVSLCRSFRIATLPNCH